MYSAVQGLFGVAIVLASYEVRRPNRRRQALDRRHLYTDGWDLLSASFPRELLESIHHAMIGVLPVSNYRRSHQRYGVQGYLNYYEKGYMHRQCDSPARQIDMFAFPTVSPAHCARCVETRGMPTSIPIFGRQDGMYRYARRWRSCRATVVVQTAHRSVRASSSVTSR
jgi:hypothetical protein